MTSHVVWTQSIEGPFALNYSQPFLKQQVLRVLPGAVGGGGEDGVGRQAVTSREKFFVFRVRLSWFRFDSCLVWVQKPTGDKENATPARDNFKDAMMTNTKHFFSLNRTCSTAEKRRENFCHQLAPWPNYFLLSQRIVRESIIKQRKMIKKTSNYEPSSGFRCCGRRLLACLLPAATRCFPVFLLYSLRKFELRPLSEGLLLSSSPLRHETDKYSGKIWKDKSYFSQTVLHFFSLSLLRQFVVRVGGARKLFLHFSLCRVLASSGVFLASSTLIKFYMRS